MMAGRSKSGLAKKNDEFVGGGDHLQVNSVGHNVLQLHELQDEAEKGNVRVWPTSRKTLGTNIKRDVWDKFDEKDTWGPGAAGTEESWPTLARTSSLLSKSGKYLKQQKSFKIHRVQQYWGQGDTLVVQESVGYWRRPRAAVSFTNGGHHPPYPSLFSWC